MKNLLFFPFVLIAMIFMFLYAWWPSKKEEEEVV
jgi:preprotein translocase subunit YajC